jgi:hypothetical protein
VFNNAGECISYVAKGGDLQPAPPRLTFSKQIDNFGDWTGFCIAHLTVFGYADGTYAVTFDSVSPEFSAGPFLLTVVGGNGSVASIDVANNDTYGFDVDSTVTAEVDGQGIVASALAAC